MKLRLDLRLEAGLLLWPAIGVSVGMPVSMSIGNDTTVGTMGHALFFEQAYHNVSTDRDSAPGEKLTISLSSSTRLRSIEIAPIRLQPRRANIQLTSPTIVVILDSVSLAQPGLVNTALAPAFAGITAVLFGHLLGRARPGSVELIGILVHVKAVGVVNVVFCRGLIGVRRWIRGRADVVLTVAQVSRGGRRSFDFGRVGSGGSILWFGVGFSGLGWLGKVGFDGLGAGFVWCGVLGGRFLWL